MQPGWDGVEASRETGRAGLTDSGEGGIADLPLWNLVKLELWFELEETGTTQRTCLPAPRLFRRCLTYSRCFKSRVDSVKSIGLFNKMGPWLKSVRLYGKNEGGTQIPFVTV